MELRYPPGILCSRWAVPSQMPQKYHVHFRIYVFIHCLSMRCFSFFPVSPNLILLIQVLHRLSFLQLILQWSPTPQFLQYLLSDLHNSSLILFAHFTLVPWTTDRERIMADTSESTHMSKKKKESTQSLHHMAQPNKSSRVFATGW